MRHIHLATIGTVTLLALQACTHLEDIGRSEGVALQREEASIPFASQRSAVHSWQADGREGLWVQDARRDWYYAKFNAPCFGIDNAIQVGFDTGTSDRIDRFSHVVVPNERDRCAIISFTKSEPPPDGKRRTLMGEEVK